jgi:hypothetical protein
MGSTNGALSLDDIESQGTPMPSAAQPHEYLTRARFCAFLILGLFLGLYAESMYCCVCSVRDVTGLDATLSKMVYFQGRLRT